MPCGVRRRIRTGRDATSGGPNTSPALAIGVGRNGQILWAIALANLAYAALITYSAGNRSGAMSVRKGAVVGAVVGFLLWFTADFVYFGISNLSNLTLTIVDPVAELIHGGIGGAVIGLVLSRMSASRPEPMHAGI